MRKRLFDAAKAGGAVIALWLSAAGPLVGGLIIMAGTEPFIADKVAIVERPIPEFTHFSPSDTLSCEYAVLAPSDAMDCPDESLVALSDLGRGEIVTSTAVHAVEEGWAIVEVASATSPPAGGEEVWIIGRVPAAKSDEASVEIVVDGIALGVRGERLVVAVPIDEVSRLGPALAAEPSTVVGVRAVGRGDG